MISNSIPICHFERSTAQWTGGGGRWASWYLRGAKRTSDVCFGSIGGKGRRDGKPQLFEGRKSGWLAECGMRMLRLRVDAKFRNSSQFHTHTTINIICQREFPFDDPFGYVIKKRRKDPILTITERVIAQDKLYFLIQ